MTSFRSGNRIPRNITRHHLILATQNWHLWAGSLAQDIQRSRGQRYAVCYQDGLYMPKLLIAVANIYANGTLLQTHTFSGGREANRFLEQRGFEVIKVKAPGL